MRKFQFRFKSIFGGKLLSAVVRLLRRRGLQLLMAAVFTGVLLVACYIYDNVPHSLLGSASVSQRYEIAKSALLGLSDKVPDDVMLVNIAYDRELVNYYDELQPEFPLRCGVGDRPPQADCIFQSVGRQPYLQVYNVRCEV